MGKAAVKVPQCSESKSVISGLGGERRRRNFAHELDDRHTRVGDHGPKLLTINVVVEFFEAVKERGVRGIDTDLLGLKPVALPHSFEGKHVCRWGHEAVKTGKRRGIATAHPRPNNAVAFDDGVAADLHSRVKCAADRFSRRFETIAVDVKQPAMEGTAQTTIFEPTEGKVHATMRARSLHQAEVAKRITKEHQFFAKQRDRNNRTRTVKFNRERRGLPICPQNVPTGGSRSALRQQPVLFRIHTAIITHFAPIAPLGHRVRNVKVVTSNVTSNLTGNVTSDEPWMWSALETAAKTRRGEISAREVIASQLARLDSVNGELNAVTRRNDEAALAAADALDNARARGHDLGPLAGVGITIKDSADVAGQSTPNGVAAMNTRLATADAPAVAHLRAAGAIVIGRTNAPEFSWRWHTDNPLFGATMNPWNPTFTPGGSSGGAAAAVAAGIGALAHGSDAGGSLRWPAACCGVSTIRPTQHRVASHNTTADGERSPALDLMAVHGPIARSVADVRTMLEVMAQPSWRDPSQVPIPFNFDRARTGRVLVATGISSDPRVTATVHEAVTRLADSGWSVREIEPPFLVEAAQLWARMLNTDFDHTTRARMVELASPTLRQMLEVLQEYSGGVGIEGYIAGFARRSSILREWQRLLTDEADVLLMPVTRGVTWAAGSDEHRASLEKIVVEQEPLTAINFLGLPSAAQPVHVVDGMPMSVQLVAARFNEASTLAAAEVIESHGRIDYQTLWSNPSR